MIKLSLRNSPAFIVGLVLGVGASIAGTAIATEGYAPQIEALIQETVSRSVTAAMTAQERKQEEELARLPDPLNCNSFSWMERCEEINKQAKKHPTAHLRVVSKDGVEFNFPPGTSSAVMAHHLNGDDASTQQYIDSIDREMGSHQKAADRYKRLLLAQGGFKNFETSADAAVAAQGQALPTINAGNTSITIFYDSNCGQCPAALSNLSILKEKYPDLHLAAFQVNDDRGDLERMTERYGIPARILSDAEHKQIQDLGVRSLPTMWIDNRTSKYRIARSGAKSVPILEADLERVSLYQGAN